MQIQEGVYQIQENIGSGQKIFRKRQNRKF